MIYVDLDETLWLTTSLHVGGDLIPNVKERQRYWKLHPYDQIIYWEEYGRNVRPMEIDGMWALNALHPQATVFLRKCKSLAETAILTYGDHETQDSIWEQWGLSRLGINLYAYEDMDFLPRSSDSMLVDNRPATHPHCAHKLRALGINYKRLIQVPDYDGSPTAINLMSEVFPVIQRLISSPSGKTS